MEALSQALEIVFEMQRKRSNEKIARRKISFLTHRMYLIFNFNFSLLFGPLLLSKLLTFHFLFILNDLKCYKSATFSSTNHH